MIYWEENQIGFCNAVDFLKEEALLIQLKGKKKGDLILDCSNKTIPMAKLKPIELFQKGSNHCFVIIIPTEIKHSYPSEWVIVPTKTEALDYISFVQMQRDLGI